MKPVGYVERPGTACGWYVFSLVAQLHVSMFDKAQLVGHLDASQPLGVHRSR